ncbi:membrane protein [Streptomyces sp. NRRL S-1022]|uniref:membrane protein n=1 Tax=Streptomyces sp. NRRL S-1022 TaxID=1463880 RepID=UPI0004BF8885|nr:membrane protein [Streptomyces sp. NRRL S-1022]
MTSRTDTAGHPDVAEISDLTEGLLPPDRGTDVRRHLDACEACADVYVSLEEIRGLLGSVPAAERMPDDVAARIDAALAAEALPAVGDEDTADHVSRETSTSADRPAGRPRATTGPGRKDKRGRRRGRLVLGAVLTAAVLGAGSLVLASLGDSGDHTTAHGTPTGPAETFSGDSVQHQVKTLLTTEKGLQRGSERPRLNSDGGSGTPGSTEGPNTLIQTAVPVPDCVRQALRQSADVLGAKTGTYAGKAAYLVVVADAEDSKRVTAYVVEAGCVHQQTASAGTVLLKQSVARP